MHLPEGTLLQNGKYKIIRFLNRGGFGCTYEACQTLMDVRVAIKELFVSDFCNREENFTVSVGVKSRIQDFLKLKRSFIKEASVLFKLRHPNIVHVTDVFEENGTAYYVMDYIEGSSLDKILQMKFKLTEREALVYIRQICEALKYVHSQNRLHLDIKPGNIMIDNSGKAILIDFGTSKYYNEQTGEQTSVLSGILTKAYAPLELIDGSFHKFNPAADIYSLGATVYKLLTGHTPPNAYDRYRGRAELFLFSRFFSASTKKFVEEAMQILSEKRPQTIEELECFLNAKIYYGDYPLYFDDIELMPKNLINGHQFVDLGLPSGLKWASCNVGALKCEDYGFYFGWGDTRTESSFFEVENETFGKSIKELYEKRIIGSSGNLTSSYDTAQLNWGGTWRMPTENEILELIQNTTMHWITLNGVNGRLATSKKNSNSIFIPAAGSVNGHGFQSVRFNGGFWSSTPDSKSSNGAYRLYFVNYGYLGLQCAERNCARPVRPVSE